MLDLYKKLKSKACLFDPEANRKFRYINFFLVALACAFDTACVAASVALNKNIQSEFGITHTEASWSLTAYAITFAGFIAIFGRVADIVGNACFFLISCAMFSIFSLLCAVVPSFEAFVVFRAFQGIAGAGVVPSSFALIPMIFDEAEAATFLSVLSIVFSACFGLGFVLGGVFAMSSSGYRGLFYLVFAIMTLVSALSYFRILPLDVPPEGQRRTWKAKWSTVAELDVIGAALLILSSILIVVGLTEGGDSWRHPQSYAVFTVGIVLFIFFFSMECQI